MLKIIIIICVCFACYGFLKMKKPATGNNNNVISEEVSPIKYLEYCESGGMENMLYRIVIEGDWITVETCEGNGYKTIKKTYKADENLYAEISEITGKYQIKAWTDLPDDDSGIVATDDTTKTFNIIFVDDTSIWVTDSKKVPGGGRKGIYEIVSLIEEFIG